MSRASDMAEILWKRQDLRERAILAEAEQVKIERHIREVVRDPRNRLGRYGAGFIPLYTDPAGAVEALRGLTGLAYLIRPGMKNRIKPGVLLEKWEVTANTAAILRSQLARFEEELFAAGIDAL
jgi:hypothetical protein